MKKRLVLLLLSFSICSVLQGQEWIYKIDEAKEIAAKENKSIVLVFAGSDWCAPCIKLEKKIWESEEFQKLAKDSFVMLKADFPRRRKNKLSKEQAVHNNKLAAQYNIEGNFPLVVILDSSGIIKGKIGYKNISPSAYYNKLKSF